MIIRASYPETAGDPVFHVLVHRGRPEWAIVPETVLAPLHHFGIPYRTLDLAERSLAAHDLDGAAGLLVAQEGLGDCLGPADLRAVADHVRRGLGVVSLDGALAKWGSPWLEFLGLKPVGGAFPCVLLRIADAAHPIAATRRVGEEVRVRIPVSVEGVRLHAPTPTVLLDTGRAPEIGPWGERRAALVATIAGRGRVVQSLVSPRVWLREHVGHGNGLTDLFWKSIAWSARRPFVMQAIPPFVTTRLDNVTGNRDRLRYLDAFNRHGYVAVAGLYVREVSDDDAPRLRDMHERGLVECSAHSLDEDSRNLVYGAFDLQDLPEAELAARIEEVDWTFARWGIPPARVLNAHWGIVGRTAVPFLRARGLQFLMKPLRFGKAMYGDLEAVNEGWRPRPFGNYDLVMDAMPEFDDFYVASVQLPRGEGIDFLQGCPTCGAPDPIRDVEQAAQKGARMLRRGLENLFFGCLLTHEGRVYELPEGHLDRVLTRIDELLEGWPRFHRGYDYVAEYARSRDGSYIRRVALDDRGRLAVELAGESTVEQHLYLFTDADDRLRHAYAAVPPFTGRAVTTCDPRAAAAAPRPPAPPARAGARST